MGTGKQIKKYLNDNGIKQNWLSNQTNISPAKLTESLNEKRKINTDEYEAIIQALNLPANKFIKEKIHEK